MPLFALGLQVKVKEKCQAPDPHFGGKGLPKEA